MTQRIYAGKGVKDDQEALALLVGKLHEAQADVKKAGQAKPYFRLAKVNKNGTLDPSVHFPKESVVGGPSNIQVNKVEEHIHLVYHTGTDTNKDRAEYRAL